MLSFIPFTVLCQTLTENEKLGHIGYIFFQVMSFITISLLIAREMTQAMLSFSQYILNYSNWIDICLMVSTMTILIFEAQIPNHVSRILRTCIILLAAAEYFNMLGMVRKNLKVFFKSLKFKSTNRFQFSAFQFTRKCSRKFA